MKLVPREREKLELHNAGFLSQKRLARGLRLNYTEAVALIATQILEFARDGDKAVTDLMDIGKQLLGRRQVLPAVPHLLDTVQVEGTFLDGTKLVTIHDPIASENGNLQLALYGSFLPVPSFDMFGGNVIGTSPGELSCGSGNIALNLGRRSVKLKVVNKADRPIQVGSHYHFIEVNPYLFFDRRKAFGMRLNIPAGTAIRFEPGDAKVVNLVSIGGKKVIRGGNAIVDGHIDIVQLDMVMKDAEARGFGNIDQLDASEGVTGGNSVFTAEISRENYAHLYGPTTGDKIRLGDTELYAEIERDFAVYGDECVFGGGKVLRDGMGQASGYPSSSCLDMVITNAVIIDYTGIYKADIGIKGGFIVDIGKAGNPDIMDGVHSSMIVGVNTEVIAAEGMIITAGGIDCHIHFICPQLALEAISSGVTTLVGGGTGPANGTRATTCTPAPFYMQMMLQSTDDLPINIGFTGKGNASKPDGLVEIIKAGAMGLKLHEDWGSTPAAIDNCLAVAEHFDIQVNIHTDTLNESGCVEHTIAAFKDRTIHTYHSEGAGGGHAPDIIRVCGVKNVLPSSTNPTRPFTRNTVDEHLDMLLVCHHLDKDIPEDVAFAESRIRAETIAAEDILHDMGAISIISSDSQAMGRVGEVIIRTWQTAHKMKLQRGRSIETTGSDHDNFRIKRFIAKYTINPAIANGFSQLVGSVEAGKFADLVMWKPSFFGAKPEMVVKGGVIAWANMGDPNASIPTPQPASNLYVKNIDDSVDDNALWEHFNRWGNITSAKVMRDDKGINKGFEFVCFSTEAEAVRAKNTLHGYMFHGKPLYVAIAERKEERRARIMHLHNVQRMVGLEAGSTVDATSTSYSPNFYAPTRVMESFSAQDQHTYRSFGPRSVGQPSKLVPPSSTVSQHVPFPVTHGDMNNLSPTLPALSNAQEMEMLCSTLVAATPQQQKDILGQLLLPLVEKIKPNLATKINEMLLEMDSSELLILLESPESLAAKVEEAILFMGKI